MYFLHLFLLVVVVVVVYNTDNAAEDVLPNSFKEIVGINGSELWQLKTRSAKCCGTGTMELQTLKGSVNRMLTVLRHENIKAGKHEMGL